MSADPTQMWTSTINMALELIQWLIIGFLLILPLLYELSNTFRYYAKFTLYYALVMLISTVVIIYGVFRPRDTRNHGFIIMAMKLVKRLYGIEIEIRGKENLESAEPYVVMCNHQSSLDVLGMFEIWPDRCVSLMKKELIYAGPFGPAAWLCHAIFIDRLNHEKAIETLQSTAKTIQEKKLKVYIFPEGTRNYGGSIASFKKGGFHLAIQAQVPIVPVVFSSYSEFYSKREKRFTTGKFIITCLPAVPTKGLKPSDVGELTERVRQLMLDAYNQISLEVTQTKHTNGTK